MKQYLLIVLAGASLSKAMTEVAKKSPSIPAHRHLGGIQSLSCARKDDRTIAIVGHVPAGAGELSMLTPADEKAKELILPHLERLSKREHPSAYVTFYSRETLEKCAHKCAQQTSSTIYIPLKFALSCLALENNYSYNNLSIVSAPGFGPFDQYHLDPAVVFSLEFFPELAYNEGLPELSVFDLNARLTAYLAQQRKEFFAENGAFSRFTQSVLKKFSRHNKTPLKPLITLSQYYELLDYAVKKTTSLAQSAENSWVKKRALLLLNRLNHMRTETKQYLSLYDIQDNSKTLVEILLTIITCEGTLKKTIQSFGREFIGPLILFRNLMEYTSVLEQAQTKPVILILPFDDVGEFVEFLARAEYEVHTQGTTPIIKTGQEMAVTESPFSEQQVNSFFINCLDQLSPEKPGKVIQPEKRPILKCTVCQTECTPDTAKVLLTEGRPVCSLVCFAEFILNREPLRPLKTLLEEKKRSESDHNLIHKLGTLCFLRALTLGPLVHVSRSSCYTLIDKKLLTALEEPLSDTLTNFTHELGIDTQQLSIFCKIYDQLKKDYIQNMRRPTKHHFDHQGTLTGLQTVQYQGLEKLFECDINDPTVYPRVFTILCERMLDKKITPSELKKRLIKK